jgi:hypothetical protein
MDEMGNESDTEWWGERVELNAMTSEQLIRWLEAKLEEHGVAKIVPDSEAMEQAYQRAALMARLQQEAERLAQEPPAPFPDDLSRKVKQILEERPELSRDQVVREIAKAETD